jgi:UDP-2,3-diacylglucosamine hydrolase
MAGVKSPRRSTEAKRKPLGIVCGAGIFPLAVAEAVTRRGRPVVLLALRGFADAGVERFSHEWVPFGAFGTTVRLARRHGVRDLVVIGSVHRPRLLDFRLDWTTLKLLPRLAQLYRGGDDHLLSGVAAILHDHGFRLVGVHEVAPELLVPAGVLGAHRPSAEDETDIALGLALLRALGPFDVGQAVAVSGRRVLGIEAAEGTAGLLGRLAKLRQSGLLKLPPRAGVLIKAPKPGQSRQIDLPAVGAETVTQAAAAGLRGIAVEAGGTIIADAAVMIRAADRAGLFLVGVPAHEERR